MELERRAEAALLSFGASVSKANENETIQANKKGHRQQAVRMKPRPRRSTLPATAAEGGMEADEVPAKEPEDGEIERALRRKAMDGNVSATQLLWKMGCLEQRKDQHAAKFLLDLVELMLSRKDLCRRASCGGDE